MGLCVLKRAEESEGPFLLQVGHAGSPTLNHFMISPIYTTPAFQHFSGFLQDRTFCRKKKSESSIFQNRSSYELDVKLQFHYKCEQFIFQMSNCALMQSMKTQLMLYCNVLQVNITNANMSLQNSIDTVQEVELYQSRTADVCSFCLQMCTDGDFTYAIFKMDCTKITICNRLLHMQSFLLILA